VAGKDNLRVPTSEQAREIGRKGGLASAEAKKRRKTMAELATLMLNAELTDKNKSKIKEKFKIEDDDITVASAMMAGQIQSAISGDSRAFNTMSALIKEQEEKVAREEAERIAKLNSTYHMDLYDIPDTFHPIARAIRDEEYQEFVEEGGRGGTKSTFFAMMGTELMRNYHDIHWVVVRKVGNTLKDSVYSKIKWAIRKQKFTEEFDATKSPLEITLTATGQKIYFRGADDPDKIKSIAPEFGYIAIVWFEELDQFTPEEVRNITQSVIRGGEKAWIFKSFNPPKSNMNWVNQYIKEPKTNMLVHHSTYLDVPKKWLGQPFIDEAEHLKEVNPNAYEHEYLGMANGTGGLVFEFLEIREIPDEEYNTFDRIHQGVDWGWFPDQYAFLRTHYDHNSEKIFFMDEIYVNKTSNADTAKMILDRQYNDYRIICDSAEPKSIEDYRGLGLPAVGAIKGAGSVEYGFKWLQKRTLVIDPRRTPNAYEEIKKYEYERDKEGNFISGYPDGNDHIISALRYQYEPLFNKKGYQA
jgi:phage terminase large subunit